MTITGVFMGYVAFLIGLTVIGVICVSIYTALGQKRQEWLIGLASRAFMWGMLMFSTGIAAAMASMLIMNTYSWLTHSKDPSSITVVVLAWLIQSPFLILLDPEILRDFSLIKNKVPESDVAPSKWRTLGHQKTWFNELHMTDTAAQLLTVDYLQVRQAVASASRTFQPVSLLPADKILIRCAIRVACRSKDPFWGTDKEDLGNAYAFTAYFIDDKLAEAMNRKDESVTREDHNKELERSERIGRCMEGVSSSDVVGVISMEAANLKAEWDVVSTW